MTTRLANLGYLALKKQTDKDVAVLPDVYVPLYKESLNTKINLDTDNPIAGNKADVFQHIQGLRDHGGDIQILAEPISAGLIFDMLLKKGTTSGASDPYTHPFNLTADDPNAYTVDIAKGQVVFRYIGVEAYELSPEFGDNKMMFNVSLAARKSFIVREVASVTSTEVIFKTDYDPSPTTGLIIGDIIRIQKANGTYLDGTILTVDSAIKVTLNASFTGVVAGDLFFIRAATPSFTALTPFLWARTEFRFSNVSAAAALSATHTPLESGSAWSIKHEFANNEGEKRSGSFDPAELARKLTSLEMDVKAKFDDASDMNRFLTNQFKACVVRHFSGANHELRITSYRQKFIENPVELNTGDLLYAEGKMKSEYSLSDGYQFKV
jgi:hypothetical protein